MEVRDGVVPNPSFLAKKIPTWKLTVREWNSDEFKTQVAALFDELNEVCFSPFLLIRSSTDGFRRSRIMPRSRRSWPTRRVIRRSCVPRRPK